MRSLYSFPSIHCIGWFPTLSDAGIIIVINVVSVISLAFSAAAAIIIVVFGTTNHYDS